MSYLSKETVLNAYKELSNLSAVPYEQGATQKVSTIRYLFALDMFYKQYGRECNTKKKEDAAAFIDNVGKVVSVNNYYFTSNFYSPLKSGKDYSVGSNFYSVNVVRESTTNGNVKLVFPRRGDHPIMRVQSGELYEDKSLISNIDYYISTPFLKTAMVLWLLRNAQLNEADYYNSVKSSLDSLFTKTLITAILPNQEVFTNNCQTIGVSFAYDVSALNYKDFTNLFAKQKPSALPLEAQGWLPIVKEKELTNFLLKCVEEQVENDGLVSMSSFISTDMAPGKSITIASKEHEFSLTGMFICTTKEDIFERNENSARWFNEEFSLNGQTVFLSMQWCREGDDFQLTLKDYMKMLGVCYPGQYSYSFENNMHILMKRNAEAAPANLMSITSIINTISQTGLIYNDTIIKRLCFSLMTKRFVILSGLSGSGKTQLALALAHAFCENLDKQLCFVPVGADWTNREPLLGYPNALKNDDYVLPENGALSLLLEAQKPDNQNKPYFLILDEMNLSVVERYFADFLSAIEAKNEPIHLWNPPKESSSNVPSSVALGRNVFIIGTINVDETTYMFSPKVLDRANVIEFKITSEEMRDFLESNPDTDISKADGKASEYAADFVAEHNPDPAEAINDTLNSFFEQLKKANAEFGYRSAHEIAKFIGIALSADDSENKMSVDEAVDAAIVQKLLPKLHGSKKKLTPILNEMFKLCFDDDEESAKITLDNVTEASIKSAKYKLSAEKIQRMYKWVSDNGFASYAES